MCGIVGYNGNNKNCLKFLINGLKKLEYRGYDSAGVAFRVDDETRIVKAKGRISNLEDKLEVCSSGFGIGHTRWATHGEPSEVNSHPHHVGSITLVHNGIIENYKDLKDELLNYGYSFVSDTDTEVACALIDYFYKSTGDILKSLSMFIDKVRGAYALGVMVEGSDKLYSIRKDCPLIIARGSDGNFIASDIIAVKKYADSVLYLDAGVISSVGPDSVNLYDSSLNSVNANFIDIVKGDDETDLCGFDHYMLKEIHEQPRVFKDTAEFYIDGSNVVNLPDFSKYNRIDIVACGSAYHTGLVGKNLIEEYANIPVNVEIASEYRYKKNFYDKNTLVVIISQSGETADSLAALRLAKNDGIDTLAIVNVPNSSIARDAKYVIKTLAGTEIAVATTKAYSAQVATLSLIALDIALSKNLISKSQLGKVLGEIKEMPILIENTINNCNYKEIANAIYLRDDVFFIGRGIDYALCMEGSLKLKEISYIHSQAYAAGELKHGTISLINDGTPVVGVITDDSLKEKTVSNLEEVKSRGAKIVVITNDQSIGNYDYVSYIPKVTKLLSPLLTVIPLQLIAYETARLRDCNIDKPKNLAKSVTVE